MRKAMAIILLSMPLMSVADEAPIGQGSTQHGCLTIPTSISLGDDCRPCEWFNITCSCPIDYFRLDIFDRWGVKVFGTFDINRQWDGSQSGAYLPVGCYGYTILYREALDGPLLQYKGTVLFLH